MRLSLQRIQLQPQNWRTPRLKKGTQKGTRSLHLQSSQEKKRGTHHPPVAPAAEAVDAEGVAVHRPCQVVLALGGAAEKSSVGSVTLPRKVVMVQ